MTKKECNNPESVTDAEIGGKITTQKKIETKWKLPEVKTPNSQRSTHSNGGNTNTLDHFVVKSPWSMSKASVTPDADQ